MKTKIFICLLLSLMSNSLCEAQKCPVMNPGFIVLAVGAICQKLSPQYCYAAAGAGTIVMYGIYRQTYQETIILADEENNSSDDPAAEG